MKLKDKISYYIWSTNHRKHLDSLQEKYSALYTGVVLDIGGRDRGLFKKPRENVDEWIYADVVSKHNPDLLLDVSDMNNVPSESVDIVNTIELFEHVLNIEVGLDECHRVLRSNGLFICAMPFLYRVHADPSDFQRWTKGKWEYELKKRGYAIESFHITGGIFSVILDASMNIVKAFPRGIRHIFAIPFIFFNFLSVLDNFDFIRKNSVLGSYHSGYFFIARKTKV
ncbi:MAG: methyltransferase domain-containing protein [Candidatus Marinimicrobia bacterium]|jgi:SAM-dependent methyltransferase|nr:methyltransferase domain-containing protein [Candidatus Neomarinimicrobiota bacterium]